VRDLLAKALTSLGRLVEARSVLLELLDTLPRNGSRRRAAVLIRLAQVERLLGRHAEARGRLVAELGSAGEQGSLLQIEIASASHAGGDFVATHEWAEQALRGAGTARPIAAGAAGLLAVAHLFVGDVRLGRSYADRGAGLVDGLLDAELDAVPEALCWTGWAELFLEDFAGASRHFTRALELARAGGHSHLVPESFIGLASARCWVGALDDAWSFTEEALEAARLMSSAELTTMALARRTQILMWQGDLGTALRVGEEAVRLAGPNRDMWSGIGAGVLAQVKMAAGNGDAAVRELVAAGGGPDLSALGASMRPAWYDVLTEAELKRNRLADADSWAARAEEAAAGLGLTGRHGYAALARARVLRASGAHAAAADYAVRAAELFAASGIRLLEGRARGRAGAAALDAGDEGRANRELTRAKLLFAACGAHGFHQRALTELRRLGARKPRRRAEVGLTDREQEIAVLVGGGMTNRQIADRLRLSTKTVETHLGRVFRKLDVSSRTAVAARLPVPAT